MTPPSFSQPQQDAINHAYELLGEHFDNSLICVNATTPYDGKERDLSTFFWSGGYFAAIGLAHEAIRRLQSTRSSETEGQT